MKKIIQALLIIILVSIISLIVVFVFNPFNLRTKLIGSIINSYLSSNIEGYTPLGNSLIDNTSTDKNPLLNENQEKTLEDYGVNVSQLPSSVNSEMRACLIDKVGDKRADEIIGGASPSSLEVFKARSCLGE